MLQFTIRVRNFRSLEQLDWAPSGLCVLSGANGTGKSTTLNALRFLHDLFRWGSESAFRGVLGGVHFRRLGLPLDVPVEFELQVADLTWKLRFPMSNTGMEGRYGEEVLRGDKVALRAAMYQGDWYIGKERQPHDEEETRSCAKVLWDRGSAQWMKPLVDLLEGIRTYDSYWLNHVKDGKVAAVDSVLHSTGRNLWSVLANWKASPLRYRGQFEWVVQEAKRAFPGILGSIEFDRGQAYLFGSGATDAADGLSPALAADGLLTGLLHLTAVAGARAGSVIAFDEMENQLHPHAIRSLLAAMRQQADDQDLTIILTTHAPVVLNEFKGQEDRIYVLERGQPGPQPTPLDEIHDESWLSHFALGDLYERNQFASPLKGTDQE